MSETGERLIVTLRERGEAFATYAGSLSDEAFHRHPAVEAWSAAELAGHVSEFPETFARQAVALAANPGAPVHRFPEDPGRLAALARLEGATPTQAADRVRTTIDLAVSLIEPISEPGWQAEGRRVVDGSTVTARQLIERFVIGHLEMHLAQAREVAGDSKRPL